jgi:hypothetical protein
MRPLQMDGRVFLRKREAGGVVLVGRGETTVWVQ